MTLGYTAKRFVDYAGAATGLLVLTPLMIGIALTIRLDSPGNALFIQERVGRGGRAFKLIKFRTMHVAAPLRFNADGSTHVDVDDARITRVGKYLRGALDELPQLLNVLRGEMSLVGPRPDMVVHRDQYTQREWRKLDVLPGITSLAAVLGRTEIPWKSRIAVDLRYIEHWSLALDAQIIAQTLLLPFGIELPRLRKFAQEPSHGLG